MKNVSKFVQIIKTHVVFNNLHSKNHAVYDIMWKKYCTAGQVTDDNMANAHCMLDNKVTNTHSKYAKFIAFPLKQR
jgi:transcription initiation factor IIE alpha subunit